MYKMLLSKSQYTKYLKCPKLFWLYRKDKSKLEQPGAQQQQIFDTGKQVGEIACNLFHGGSEVPFDIRDMPGMVEKTNGLVKSGVETIYEASFIFDEIFVAVDILHHENGSWHIYEVKSSTSVKETYLDDAAIQAYVLEKSGMETGSVNIVHINNTYVRNGDLDIHSLFSIINITSEIAARKPQIPEQTKSMKQVLCHDEPHQEIGPHCFSPYDCSAYDYCWRTLAGIPEKSVFSLTRARQDQKFSLYRSGYIKISDVPLVDRTPAQQIQILGKLDISPEPIREFVELLEYPITHLDFETFQQAIPGFDGIKPFQQIPFQYSIHIEDGSSILHKEYLATIGGDPRRKLAERLIADIPEMGTILAYNRSFEKGVIKNLGESFPDLNDALVNLMNRIEDLMNPFQKRWYYHPEMNGSYSIKKVLPALVPEMEQAYEDLPGVHNGGEASSIWSRLPTVKNEQERNVIRQGLLEYCKLDTLAMVKILDVLRAV